VKFHFTPKGGFWINQIETFFGIITRQAIRRGDFRSVAQLIKRIGDYIEHWNEDSKPLSGQQPRARSWRRSPLLIATTRSL